MLHKKGCQHDGLLTVTVGRYNYFVIICHRIVYTFCGMFRMGNGTKQLLYFSLNLGRTYITYNDYGI